MWIKNFLFCRIMIPDLRFGWLILCWYFCVLIADDPAEYNDTPGEFFVVSFDWLSGHKNLLPMDIFRLLQPPFGEKSDFEAILVISHPFYGSILHWQTCFLWDFYCVYYNHSPSQELNFSFVWYNLTSIMRFYSSWTNRLSMNIFFDSGQPFPEWEFKFRFYWGNFIFSD